MLLPICLSHLCSYMSVSKAEHCLQETQCVTVIHKALTVARDTFVDATQGQCCR